MTDRAPYLTCRLQGFGTTIFAEMSALAARTGAISLGQGFPDTDGPAEVAEAAARAIRAGHNQYPPGAGTPDLRAAVSDHECRFWGLDYDPEDEILVTAGATEAIAAALMALCEVGDEVVTFEPYYDSYGACVAMAGATRRVVTLAPPDFALSIDAVAAAITPKTRLLLLNSPHNPSGKVFSAEELAAIAELCVDHDLLAVSDEVYEHVVFDGSHVPLATFPGMRERTVTGGKDLCVHWLERRLGLRCARAPAGSSHRQAVPYLCQRGAVPARHRGGPPLGRRILQSAGRWAEGQTRPALRRLGRSWVRGVEAGGHLLRDRRHPPADRRGRHRLLPCAP